MLKYTYRSTLNKPTMQTATTTQKAREIASLYMANQFVDWLLENPITERQLLCWMAAQDVQGWLPISRIYKDFIQSGEHLAEYLSDNHDNCAALMRWVKHCSDARWPGVVGLYDSFIDWVAV